MWFELFVCLSVISHVLSQATNYLYIPEGLTWAKAGTRCQAMGYTLATPRDSTENKKLVDYLATVTERNMPTDVWIGGKVDDSNTWRWLAGGEIEYFDWSVANNQPNDVKSEQCIRIRMQDQHWWNKQCFFVFPSVCQFVPVREASFNLLENNKSPTGTPLNLFSVTSASECTLRCMDDYRCKLYSVRVTSHDPVVKYECLLFSSDSSAVPLEDVADTRLYSRQA